MYNTLYIAYTIGLLLSIVCVFVVALQHSSKEQLTVMFVTVFVAIIMTGYWFSLQADNVKSAAMAQKLIYIGGCQIYYALLRFFVHYCRMKTPLWLKGVLLGINTTVMLSVVFMENNDLMYKSVDFKIVNGIPTLVKDYGPLHTVYIIMVISYMLAMIGIVIRQLFRKNGLKMIYGTVMLLIVALVPTATYLTEKILDLPFDIVPFGLIFAESVIVVLVYQLKIYDVNDTARDYIFTGMDDALIVVDKNCHFKGANNAAYKLFPKLAKAATNDNIYDIDTELAGIIMHNHSEDISFENRTYMPIIKPIEKKKSVKGYIARFFDVTAEREKTEILENYNYRLADEVNKKTERLQDIQKQVIVSFANIVENRDNVTGSHVKRTSTYVEVLINSMKKHEVYADALTSSYVSHVKLAAPLHDVGKIAISDVILNKPGKFTDEEFSIMKKHTTIGAQIVEKNLLTIEDNDYFNIAKDITLYHHEKWNGKGYPSQLKGNEIPLCARIMAIADVFDALISERPYKLPYTLDQAFEIIESESGVSFDPALTEAFLSARVEIERMIATNRFEMLGTN